jgi:hypothetical protein
MTLFYLGLFIAHVCGGGIMLYIDIQKKQDNDVLANFYTDYLQNTVEKIWIIAFTEHNSMKTKIARQLTRLYHAHPYITYVTDVSVYGYNYIPAICYERCIEPFQSNWTTHSLVLGNQTKYIETYKMVHDNNSISKIYTFLRNINLHAESLNKIKLNNTFIDKLLYAKFGNIYISRVKITGDSQIQSLNDFSKVSKVVFLTVSIKSNKTKININMKKEWMYVNNELFSTAFLERYFRYNNVDCQLATDYVVNIMDDNINMFQLKSCEYILLDEKTYQVKTRE